MTIKGDKKDIEAEIMNAILAFEQILEAMPNDKASLEALSHAYEQLGDHTKAKDYFIMLARVIMEENDHETIKEMLPKIKTYGFDDADAKKLADKMEKMVALHTEASAKLPLAPTADQKTTARKAEAIKATFNMAEELALAWNLMEAKEITQEAYANIVQDLTEMSAGDSAATVSVLHVLEARGFKGIERIICYLASQCSAPYISLANFEILYAPATVLPPEFITRRGAFIFDFIGKDATAVVLNPYDKQLRKDVEAISGRKCHFFVTLPSEFDQAVEKMNDLIAQKADEELKDKEKQPA
ncbi:MAG: hypothetical protein PHW12_10685, partial [Smithella sp.]|nr:hypothetical protein [Smithella sp.]